MMFRFLTLVCVVVTVSCGDRSEPVEHSYELRGQVLSVDQARGQVTIRHDAIEGLMPAMTMPFTVREPNLLEGVVRGDLVTGTLRLGDGDAYLSDLTKVGHEEVVEPAPPPPASSGFELIRPGEPVPDEQFVDQDGQPRRLSDWQGQSIAITFIYTRCPIATFCPTMDQHFEGIQRAVLADDRLRDRVHLLSVSFDPAYDTPAVLKRHAATTNADPAVWSFLTGDRDEIDRFASRFGVSILRNETDPRDITHNLRTVIVDAWGRLVKTYTGFDWTPGQVVADFEELAALDQAPHAAAQ